MAVSRLSLTAVALLAAEAIIAGGIRLLRRRREPV